MKTILCLIITLSSVSMGQNTLPYCAYACLNYTPTVCTSTQCKCTMGSYQNAVADCVIYECTSQADRGAAYQAASASCASIGVALSAYPQQYGVSTPIAGGSPTSVVESIGGVVSAAGPTGRFSSVALESTGTASLTAAVAGLTGSAAVGSVTVFATGSTFPAQPGGANGSNPTSTPTAKKSSVSSGAVAGISIGITLAVVTIAAVAGYLLWRRRRQLKPTLAVAPAAPAPQPSMADETWKYPVVSQIPSQQPQHNAPIPQQQSHPGSQPWSPSFLLRSELATSGVQQVVARHQFPHSELPVGDGPPTGHELEGQRVDVHEMK
ncbi:hypothetical protein BCR34DRAFT_605663 [Clohesyomyces aquaticus]|uniref:CFEM domain-containing protein n=1 Tax=Clohesyomyces aquaticus TaxID=1231657 RepID=A0A1Y1YVV4_9PLEO|nr:hypothetical protein BCR34DRAFT_605663 [Clohesyomyces aquaticus]